MDQKCESKEAGLLNYYEKPDGVLEMHQGNNIGLVEYSPNLMQLWMLRAQICPAKWSHGLSQSLV